MKPLTLLFLLACSLKSFSIGEANCADTADLFTFSKKPLDSQLQAKVNLLISDGHVGDDGFGAPVELSFLRFYLFFIQG